MHWPVKDSMSNIWIITRQNSIRYLKLMILVNLWLSNSQTGLWLENRRTVSRTFESLTCSSLIIIWWQSRLIPPEFQYPRYQWCVETSIEWTSKPPNMIYLILSYAKNQTCHVKCIQLFALRTNILQTSPQIPLKHRIFLQSYPNT